MQSTFYHLPPLHPLFRAPNSALSVQNPKSPGGSQKADVKQAVELKTEQLPELTRGAEARASVLLFSLAPPPAISALRIRFSVQYGATGRLGGRMHLARLLCT